MIRIVRRPIDRRRRGSALVSGMLALVVLMSFAALTLQRALRDSTHRNASVEGERALLAARSGVADVVARLGLGVEDDLGSANAPVALGSGSYWATVTPGADGTFTVVSTGLAGQESQAVEVCVAPAVGGVFGNAIFAGNSSEDPLYTLELGGSGGQADVVGGDVYSGGDVAIVDDADVTGTIRAAGTITGASGEQNAAQRIPDIAGADYANTADFDVAALFGADGVWAADNAGGSAWQLPEENAGHIFRKNPTDRSDSTSHTEKDDYFLEDPYEPISADYSQNGSSPYPVTLSGVGSEGGTPSNGRVFYIDGNLWVHNRYTYSLGFQHDDPNGLQVTFVVNGNIYFSDNVFYEDADRDGVAFIAVKDEAVADSGNIYLGDPEFGTLKRMHAFMYAENDFYDINLDESGSARVEIFGNMTAGNQVVIDRDFVAADGDTSHTKLTVDFDERVMNGALDLPGLPSGGTPTATGWRVTSWRRVALQ